MLGRSFAAYAGGRALLRLRDRALVSGADSALLYDAYAADGRAHEFARAKGALEAVGLAGAAVAFPLAGLLVTADGDPTPTYTASAVIPLAGDGRGAPHARAAARGREATARARRRRAARRRA